jgi:hypothetical protein
MRSTGKSEVTVAIDQSGDDRRASGVHDLGLTGVLLAVGRLDPGDAAVTYENADAKAKRR